MTFLELQKKTLKQFRLKGNSDIKFIVKKLCIDTDDKEIHRLYFVFRHLETGRLIVFSIYVNFGDFEDSSLFIDDEQGILQSFGYQGEGFKNLKEMLSVATDFYNNELTLTKNDPFNFMLGDTCYLIDNILEDCDKKERTGTRLIGFGNV